MPLSGGRSLSPYATTLLFPPLTEPQPLWLGPQTDNGELDGRPDAPSRGFHVKPPADDLPAFRVAAEAPAPSGLRGEVGGLTSFEYTPKTDFAPYVGAGSTNVFRPADGSRSPLSFLDRKAWDAGPVAGELNSPHASTLPWSANLATLDGQNPAGSGAFRPLAYGPPWAEASSASSLGGLAEPPARAAPMLSRIFFRELLEGKILPRR